MRNIWRTLALLCIPMLLGACSLLKPELTGWSDDIQPGMSMEEVQKAMGRRPHYRRFDELGEQWEYRKGPDIYNDDRVMVIDFRDGHVSSMNSFVEHRPPKPEVEVKK